MSLEHSDGTAKTNIISEIYPNASGSVSYTTTKGAFGVTAIDCSTNSFCPIQHANAVATRFWNFWFQFTTGGTGTFTLWQAFDSIAALTQISLQITSSGVLQLFRGATLLASATGPALINNIQYHIEIKAVIDPTTGSCEVRINGNPSPVINFTGNTRNSTNSFTDQTRLGPTLNVGGAHNYYSHIVIFVDTGAAPNAFIGMKRIYTSVPTADSATGGLNQFSTSPSQTSGNHWQNVDEEPPDEDTSYNFDSVTNDRESYRVNGLPSSVSTISVVNAFARLRIDDAGPHTLKITARNGTTDTLGATQSISASYLYYNEPFPLDPNTGSAWTPGGFGTSTNSTAEFGVKIIS